MQAIVNGLIRSVLRVFCHVDTAELGKVPISGPLIIYSNHIGQFEVPLLYTQLYPRPIIGMAKSELWENPFLRTLLDLWGAIPVRRGKTDPKAMRAALDALRREHIVAIAPEGTLNPTGALKSASSGVAALALRSGAPVLPLAHWGVEQLAHNLRHVRRTEFNISVGVPFRIDLGAECANRRMRRAVVDEMMFRLAALLPACYRGAYADVQNATTPHLRNIDLMLDKG